ncbi:MAG: hypothetical protein IJG80_07270 [Selenomonadaceae bacterium]|nr:hypothetical protein [Selenomonadaceae bacterium]MBQ3434255.1 hypothetical protein [Selenomonadaceae bacterium]
MEEVIRHLRAASAILQTVHSEAQARYERHDKRRREHVSAEARRAWCEYYTSGEAITRIDEAVTFVNELSKQK